eukprot:8654-Heterococcus_DN1.PRE.3
MDESAAPAAGVINVDEGWAELKSSFLDPVAAYVVDTTANDEQLVLEDGCSSTLFVTMYTLVYNMCTQRSTYNCSEQLYERYDGTLRAFVGAYSE